MAVVANPYSNHQAQLGVLEMGLKSLKTEKTLMGDSEFSDMYWAVERHHRDLKLAHLTGKAKDLMDQAEKDTKFYNILIKMLCEVKRLPTDKQKDSLKKVHLWYRGNRHTLRAGPRFGKTTQRQEGHDMLNGSMTIKSRTPSARQPKKSPNKSTNAFSSSRQSNKENKQTNKRTDPNSAKSESHDDLSSPRGYMDSMHVPSEPASSRMSTMGGHESMTHRFLSELPSSKLSWHIETPYDNVHTPIDWDEPVFESLPGVAESSLSRPTYDFGFGRSFHSGPVSSPVGEDLSPRSLGSDPNNSSRADPGSMDMMDFHSDARRHLSRGQASGGSIRNGMSDDPSSSSMYGLPRKMVHSIASLVNPHAKLAESEAQRAELEYRQQSARSLRSGAQSSMAGRVQSSRTSRGQSAASKAPSTVETGLAELNKGQNAHGSQAGSQIDLSAHIPVLRSVSVASGAQNNLGVFSNFHQDHLFGQDILSLPKKDRKPLIMPPIASGRLNFVGRSGTALDVRYNAHGSGDMPEHHTHEVIALYGMHSGEAPGSSQGLASLLTSPRATTLVAKLVPATKRRPAAKQSESQIHHQTLEDFYQAAEHYYPTHLPKYGSNRIQSAPGPRVKSGGKRMSVTGGNKTPATPDKQRSTPKSTKVQKLGRDLLGSTATAADDTDDEEDMKDEVIHRPGRPGSAVKLDEVVNLIDHVKDEMNFFREKLAPTPMAGFRQPSSTYVSNKPLSRPTSTASRKSQPPTAKSAAPARSSTPPSPQGRPSTPLEPDDLMMREGDTGPNTYRDSIPSRPHSATVSKAVDWRGRITPQSARIRSKTRFGGHTYVQKMKPSLRTAGASSGGNRPKTAPTTPRDRWNTKDKEDTETLKLPEVSSQKFTSIVTTYPQYPVRERPEKAPPIITITECDRNQRVAQAASNTVTQIDDKDMDRIMSIQHLLGTSDSRYGSMGSLFLDEDFLRSLSARYGAGSSMSHQHAGVKEYLSFIGPTPRASPIDEVVGSGDIDESSRSHSRQAIRKPDVQQIPEESAVKEEDSAVRTALVDDINKENLVPYSSEAHPSLTQSPPTQIQDTPRSTNRSAEAPPTQLQDTPRSIHTEAEQPEQGNTDVETSRTELVEVSITPRLPETARSEGVKFAREVVHVECADPDDKDVRIEVTAIPATGQPDVPLADVDAAIKDLSKSEPWEYQPQIDGQDPAVTGTEDATENKGELLVPHPPEQAVTRQQQQQQNETSTSRPWAKSILKPENYCFECLPDSMSTKVGRSAGRTPGGAQSPAGQVLRMARRQNEYFKKAPPVRTPPSIPSPHHPLGGRTPRQGQQYSSELEHQARKVKSPRHYLEQVVELRKDSCRSAPTSSERDDGSKDFKGSLSVTRLRKPAGRARTAPIDGFYLGVDPSDASRTLNDSQAVVEESEEEEEQSEMTDQDSSRIVRSRPPTIVPGTQSIAHIGRPIAQVTHIPDPEEEAEAAQTQREAKAAVDIQRIFRGYVCRNSYNKLLWDNRKKAEDKQMALVESQRELRKHQSRKVKIYNRPPLDPDLIQWAHDFKQIQVQNKGKRQGKVDNMAKEMIANQVKAKSKIELIGPHVEIYDIYHPKEVGPSKRDMHIAAVCIQKHIRGFLIRRRFERLHRKAIFCGSTWKQMIKEYKTLLKRVQRWHGVEKPSTPFTVEEMYEYMDMRRRYESQFDKKSFGGELELADLEAFFRECDLYPSRAEIDEALDVVTQGNAIKKGHGLQKHQAMNALYYIYVPKATGLQNVRMSTWMNPIIDGVEARKLIGSEFVEAAPLKPCMDMVIESRRERREVEEAEKERLRILEIQKLRGDDDDDDDDDRELEYKNMRKSSRSRPSLTSSRKGSRPNR